jgi:HD superfamily phosphodiesterase
MVSLSNLITFVLLAIKKYNIDESHGLSHSMDVLYNAHSILESELHKNPILDKQRDIILTTAVLHDMCDKKYIDELEGILSIQDFLTDKMDQEEIEISKKIMMTMSYSKVKVLGYPDFGEYQLAYHIVREADLLSAYDFDRCMIYSINKNNCDISSAFDNAYELFNKRVLRHHQDNLFITDYAKLESIKLHLKATSRIDYWKKILNKPKYK